jgi:hypothetical protein
VLSDHHLPHSSSSSAGFAALPPLAEVLPSRAELRRLEGPEGAPLPPLPFRAGVLRELCTPLPLAWAAGAASQLEVSFHPGGGEGEWVRREQELRPRREGGGTEVIEQSSRDKGRKGGRDKQGPHHSPPNPPLRHSPSSSPPNPEKPLPPPPPCCCCCSSYPLPPPPLPPPPAAPYAP